MLGLDRGRRLDRRLRIPTIRWVKRMRFGCFVGVNLVGRILLRVQRSHFRSIQNLRHRSIEVPNVNLAIGASRVDILLPRCLGR